MKSFPLYNEEDPEDESTKIKSRIRRRRWRGGKPVFPPMSLNWPIITTSTFTQSQGQHQLEVEATYVDGEYDSMRYTGQTA